MLRAHTFITTALCREIEGSMLHDHTHGNDNERIKANMPTAEQCENVSAAFSQLGDPTRLKILWILCHSEQCVQGLGGLIGMSSPAVAHHLKQLKTAGLIVSRREGREMLYKLGDTEECRQIHAAMDNLFHVNCFTFTHK